MKTNTLKYIILLATISIAGVLLIQFFFLRNSYNFSQKQFKESAAVALKEVAWQIMVANGKTANFDSITPIEIVSTNLYLVNVEAIIDKEFLKNQLIKELKKHELYYDFEFAVFNQDEEQMEEGIFVPVDEKEKISYFSFPTNNKYNNYFCIHFPDRWSYFNTHLSIWYVFTILLLVVLLFFGYTLSVIIKQRQLSEIQKNFINNLTHELKTPISSIGLSANVIHNKNILKSPERLFEYTKIIKEQNERLSKNVEKVLNLASLEKNRIRLNKEELDLNEFITETIQHFKQTDFGQKATINFQNEKLTIKLEADKFHFSNLLLNVFENAVKYCKTIPIITITLGGTKKQVHLNIFDNGIGIQKEHRKKIFKKFYRVPTGNVHNVKGFGLGLDYVYKIVKAHGWKIKVMENPTGGSIFSLSFHL